MLFRPPLHSPTMPSRRSPADDPLDPAVYYGAVAERIVPFLPDRALTFTRGPQRALVHAESGTDIRIQNADDLMMHVGGGAISFFADPIGSNGEVWFALALNGSGVPFEAVRLSALKLYLVLRDVELDAFIYYDGMGGFRFLWTWGVLDPDENAQRAIDQNRVLLGSFGKFDIVLVSTLKRTRQTVAFFP